MRGLAPARSGQFLVEFLTTLIIFTLTSTIMFQLFVRGGQISAEAYDLNRAVVRAQAITEEVMATGGDKAALDGLFDQVQEGEYLLYFDGEWKETDDADGKYAAEISVARNGLMLSSDVAINKGGEEIYSIRAERYLGITDDGNAD